MVPLLAVLTYALPANAQRELTEVQNDDWYATHAALLGGVTLANAATLAFWHPSRARIDAAFRWELGTERNFSPTTSHVSDVTLATTLAAPVVTLASGSRTGWGNGMIVYGEALEGTLLLNTVTKKWVARARPYTHHPAGVALAQSKGPDAHYSFYSGHSALSFTSATTGSLLFAALHDDVSARTGHWAIAYGLASFTAHARVRAGRHYPTDVLVGSVMGISWGLAVPLLHDVRPGVRPVEFLAAGGGVLAGTLLALSLPRRMGDAVASLQPRLVPVPRGVVVSLGSGLP